MLKRFSLSIIVLLILSSQAHADLTYKIKKGDTLFGISRKFKVSVQKLREMNDFKKSVKLKIGHNLIVRRTGLKGYMVKKGDTIYSIAEKFNLDVAELMSINQIYSDELKIGQKLMVERDIDIETAMRNFEEEIKKISESEDILNLGIKDRLALFAKKFLNIPYRFGGNNFMGIDCSAYVQRVYSLIGIEIPRSARLQFNEGEAVDKDSLSIGDLVFFRTYASFPSHVGIYLGNNLFIHASSTDKKISISSLDSPYFIKRFIGAKRFIGNEIEEEKEENTEKEKQEDQIREG